jgi:hypothetical protein
MMIKIYSKKIVMSYSEGVIYLKLLLFSLTTIRIILTLVLYLGISNQRDILTNNL